MHTRSWRSSRSAIRRTGARRGERRASLSWRSRAASASEIPGPRGRLRSGRRESMNAMDVQTVGVIGCGLMGSGIAEVVARAGADVVVVEANEELLERGLARVDASLSKAVERGKLDAGERDTVRARIRGVTDLAELAGV